MGSLSTVWSSRARAWVTGLKPTDSWTELDYLATQAGWEAQMYTPTPGTERRTAIPRRVTCDEWKEYPLLSNAPRTPDLYRATQKPLAMLRIQVQGLVKLPPVVWELIRTILRGQR